MFVDNASRISFTVEGADPLVDVVTVTLTNIDTSEEIGVLRVNKNKAAPFLESLQEVLREVYDVFQDKTLATTRFDNKTQGTINFRD